MAVVSSLMLSSVDRHELFLSNPRCSCWWCSQTTQTGTGDMVCLCTQQDAQHLLFSFQAFIPAYLLCYILLEQLSFPKVTVFTHICS